MILCLCPNPAVDKFIWVEDFVPGNANRIKQVQSFAGGKGVHVALGIAELGEDCALLGFWGGHTGKHIRDYCENKGISCYGPEINEPNRTCITFRAQDELDGTELLEPGPFIEEDKMKAFWKTFTELLERASAVCISGSWPPMEAAMEYADFIVEAGEKGIKVFIDCSGDHLINLLPSKPYCIHINNHEGFEIFKENLPSKIGALISENCDLAAITCGADGLYLFDNNQGYIHAVCKLTNIISAVGSGDSLMAGLLVADKRNYNKAETAKLAVACGAANCIRADLGMFYKKDVEILLGQTELRWVG